MDRHGSPTFYALLNRAADIHDKKSHDYASNDAPSGNYHFAGLLANLFAHSSQDAGFIGRIGEKIYRLANLEKAGKQPKNESVEDTEDDILVITGLWMADRRDRRMQGIHTPVGMQPTTLDSIENKKEASPNKMSNAPSLDTTDGLIVLMLTNRMGVTQLRELRDYLNGCLRDSK